MSPISDFLTQPGFWWGTGAGSIGAAAIGFVGLWQSDVRKANQEDKVLTRKEQEERSIRELAALDNSLRPYILKSTEQLEAFIDRPKLYNFLRERTEFLSDLNSEEQKRDQIAFENARIQDLRELNTLYMALSLDAPEIILSGATKVLQGFEQMNQYISDATRSGATYRQCSSEINDLVDTYRKFVGKSPYMTFAKIADEYSYLSVVNAQIQEYFADYLKTVVENDAAMRPGPSPEPSKE